MSTENERANRTVALAQHLVKAADAMERGEWESCQAQCAQASWEARMLGLLEKDNLEQEKEP